MNARAHFRVVYPLKERPAFHASGFVCAVADVSESGMTLAAPIGAQPSIREGDRLTGTIRFRYSLPVDVDGVVLRLTKQGAVVRFDELRVPWASVQAEERALLAKYPR
jgi:hypothetical protein